MTKIAPKDVHNTIARHMLADGMDLVLDLAKSHGSFIHDSISGKDYLDFFSFFASAPLGHNHPELNNPEFIERIGKASLNNVTNSDLYTVEMAEFVETFANIAVPDYLPHLFFIAGGGLGVENALKAAFDWKVQKNLERGYTSDCGWSVLHFTDAFHGRTGYTLSLTNTSSVIKHKWFPKFDWPRIDRPAIRFPLNDENLQAVEKAEQLAVNQIKTAIKLYGDDIAAMIIEPIQGEGGDNHFRGEFFRILRQLCDENEIFLIYDEVQTGIGLTGKMWCHQHFNGAEPDAIAFGKKTQICGCAVGKRIEEVEGNVFNASGRINSTWGGNLTDMVRAQKYLEVIQEENLVANAAQTGAYLLKGIENIQQENPELISNARGRGLMIAFDLPDEEARGNLLGKLYNNGVAALGCGEQSVRFRPPLNTNKDEADMALEILGKSIKEAF